MPSLPRRFRNIEVPHQVKLLARFSGCEEPASYAAPGVAGVQPQVTSTPTYRHCHGPEARVDIAALGAIAHQKSPVSPNGQDRWKVNWDSSNHQHPHRQGTHGLVFASTPTSDSGGTVHKVNGVTLTNQVRPRTREGWATANWASSERRVIIDDPGSTLTIQGLAGPSPSI